MVIQSVHQCTVLALTLLIVVTYTPSHLYEAMTLVVASNSRIYCRDWNHSTREICRGIYSTREICRAIVPQVPATNDRGIPTRA